MTLLGAFLILLLFLLLSFCFSGFEAGIISIDRLRLEREAKNDPRKKQVLQFIQKPDKFFGTTLIANNIANVILASVSTFIIEKHFANSGISEGLTSYVALGMGGIVLIFGEIVPKAVFRDYANVIVPRFFPFLRFSYLLLKPFVWIVTIMNDYLYKLLHISGDRTLEYLTKDDIAFILSETQSDTSMQEPQREMIEDALEFNELKAKNIMVPRTEVVAIDASMTIAEVTELAKKENYTRYPVYEGSLDHVLGILIVYDIIKKDVQKDQLAKNLVHPAYFAPETMDVDHLLKEMQRYKKSMAVIVDSYGGTAGIVTMEDILEEIVGEIDDEYDDEEEKDVEVIAPQVWIVKGDVEIDHLNDEYEMSLPEGDYETIAGMVLDHLEKIPVRGQMLTIGDYRIQVLQVSARKIEKIRIKKI